MNKRLEAVAIGVMVLMTALTGCSSPGALKPGAMAAALATEKNAVDVDDKKQYAQELGNLFKGKGLNWKTEVKYEIFKPTGSITEQEINKSVLWVQTESEEETDKLLLMLDTAYIITAKLEKKDALKVPHVLSSISLNNPLVISRQAFQEAFEKATWEQGVSLRSYYGETSEERVIFGSKEGRKSYILVPNGFAFVRKVEQNIDNRTFSLDWYRAFTLDASVSPEN